MSDLEAEKKFSELYLGKVVQHLNAGKLKVYIPGIYPDEWKDQPQKLPSCIQSSPLFAGTNNGNGMFSYPNIGTIVLCMFANGDQNFPIAIGAIQGGSLAASQYVEARPIVTTASLSAGTDAYVHKINSGNTSIKIWEPGRIEITVNGNDAGSTNAKIWMDGKGTIQMQATQRIDISAPNIKIDASSALEIDTPTFTNVNGISNTTIAPSINLDAQSSGSPAATVLIKGARHINQYN